MRFPAWLHGASLGAWWGGVLWAYTGFARAGFGLIDRGRAGGVTLGAAPEYLADATGIAAATEPGIVFVIAVALGAAIGLACDTIARLLPQHCVTRAREAFFWPLQRVVGFWPTFVALCAVPFSVALVEAPPEVLVYSLPVLAVACFFALPLGVLDRAVLESPRGAGWWRPKWPGLDTLAVFVGLAALPIALGGIEDLGWAHAPPALALVWSAATALLALCCLILQVDCMVNRRRPDLRVLRWPMLARYVVWSVRQFAIGAWLVPPLLIASYYLVFDAPQLGALLKAAGNPTVAVITAAANAITTYWWLLSILPIALYTWLGAGRLYVDQ